MFPTSYPVRFTPGARTIGTYHAMLNLKLTWVVWDRNRVSHELPGQGSLEGFGPSVTCLATLHRNLTWVVWDTYHAERGCPRQNRHLTLFDVFAHVIFIRTKLGSDTGFTPGVRTIRTHHVQLVCPRCIGPWSEPGRGSDHGPWHMLSCFAARSLDFPRHSLVRSQ